MPDKVVKSTPDTVAIDEAITDHADRILRIARKRKWPSPFMFFPAISRTKLANAIDSYAPGTNPDDVVMVIDSTVFGSAKDGALANRKGLYLKDLNQSAVYFDYCDIKHIEVKSGWLSANIIINGELQFDVSGLPKAAVIQLAEVLNEVLFS